MNSIKLDLTNVEVSEKSQQILDLTKKGMGFVPNMYLGMAGNTSTLDSYTYVYDSFRRNSDFTSVEQEVVLLSVSYVNNCEYCMAAHSFVADKMSKVPTEITNALREGKELPNSKLNALSNFTKIMVEKRGWTSQEDLDLFLKAGYSETHVLAVITGIAIKTLSNYSNHSTKPELDDTFSERKWTKG